MAKKDKKAEAKMEPKVENQTADPKPEEVVNEQQTAEPKAERPAFPANFCLDPTTWDSNERIYDAGSESCKTCERDMKDTFDTCVKRDAFLAAQAGATKSKRTGERKSKEPGKPTQGGVIDGLIEKQTAMKDIVAEVAKSYFGGNVKAAANRVNRHIQRGIIGGESKNSEKMKPLVGYLTAKKEEPKAEEKAS